MKYYDARNLSWAGEPRERNHESNDCNDQLNRTYDNDTYNNNHLSDANDDKNDDENDAQKQVSSNETVLPYQIYSLLLMLSVKCSKTFPDWFHHSKYYCDKIYCGFHRY